LKHSASVVAAALLLASSAAAQQFILMPDSTADKIVKFNAMDGSLIDADFILDGASAATYDFTTPKDVFQVNNDIWVVDQIADAIYRFDSTGAWIGSTVGAAAMLDNCRGGEFVNGVVYVTNDGAGNGATADSVAMFDTTGAHIGVFSVADSGTSPFDVVGYNGELLVCHFTTANKIGRYDYAGNPLTPEFLNSAGATTIDSPEQMWVTSANTVLAAGFASPLGIYEFDSTGAQINFWATATFPRGVIELGNGNILLSDSNSVELLDRVTSTSTTVYSSTGCQFFGLFNFAGGAPTVYCTAGVTTNSCVPSISANNQPSVSAANACDITVTGVEGQKSGLIFYSITGSQASPWSATSTSFLCVKSPTQRSAAQNSGGTNGLCDGTLGLDWNAFQAANTGALGNPWSAGAKAYVQGWFRDPPAPKTTNLTDAVELTYVP